MAIITIGPSATDNVATSPRVGRSMPGSYPVDIGDLRPTDTLIAVMGMTGAGKSTFIAHCTDAFVPVGHKMTSCTQEVLIYPYRSIGKRRVFLVDTPGFDDTDRTDTQVLKEIATWLTDTFNEQVRLSGLIYLHRISDVRMQGSAKRNLFMFKKLCGPAAFKKVKLATTMWEDHTHNGEAREQELINTQDFWGYMIDQGATTYRHMNTRASALKLVDSFLDPADVEAEKLVLNIQAEMQSGTSLEDTSAGREVDIQLREIKEHYLRELESVKADQREAFAAHDRESAKALEEMQHDYNKKIENVNRGREQLRVDMEKLHRDREHALVERLQEQEEYVKKVKQQLESANDEEKTLLRQQIEMTKEANSQLQKQLTSIGQRIKRRAAVQTYSNGRNLMKYGCSVSVSDEYFVYAGMTNVRSNYPPIADALGLNYEATKYFVFGQNNSWYRHYHHFGYCHDALSDNFEENYPGFRAKCLMQRKKSTCPLTVALGTDGEYFFASQRERHWNFNPEHAAFLKTCLGGEGGYGRIKRLWLGLNQSLVCLDTIRKKLHCYNISVEPDSRYPGLKQALDRKVLLNENVKAVALSLTDPTCWLAAWKYGYEHNVGQGNIDSHQFVDWCKINQGQLRSAQTTTAKEEDVAEVTHGVAVATDAKEPVLSILTLPKIELGPAHLIS